MAFSKLPDTVLVGGAVVTVDRDRRVLNPRAIAIHGDHIVAVDDPETIREAYPDAEEIDLEGTVLLSGLVDSHGHADHGLPGHSPTGPVTGYVVEEIYIRSSNEAFWRTENHLSAVEQLEYGVTMSLSFTESMPRVDDPKYASPVVGIVLLCVFVIL